MTEDVQVLGVNYQFKNKCLVEGCGEYLPDYLVFQELHMKHAHNLEV